MKVQYLGTAAAEAIPALFCHCDICQQARRLGGKNIRRRSGLVLNDTTMIDFPPDISETSRMLGLDLGNVTDLFITHSHSDHFAVQELLLRRVHTYCDLTDEYGNDVPPLRLYGSTGMEHTLHTIAALAAHDLSYLDVRVLAYFKPVTTPTGLTFTFLPAQHKKDEPSGLYLVEDGRSRLLYAHDTGCILPEVRDFLRGKPLDLISLDCCFGPRDVSSGHMGLPQNRREVEALRALGVLTPHTTVVVNHFSHYGGMLHEQLVDACREDGFTVSYDGMTLTI